MPHGGGLLDRPARPQLDAPRRGRRGSSKQQPTERNVAPLPPPILERLTARVPHYNVIRDRGFSLHDLDIDIEKARISGKDIQVPLSAISK